VDLSKLYLRKKILIEKIGNAIAFEIVVGSNGSHGLGYPSAPENFQIVYSIALHRKGILLQFRRLRGLVHSLLEKTTCGKSAGLNTFTRVTDLRRQRSVKSDAHEGHGHGSQQLSTIPNMGKDKKYLSGSRDVNIHWNSFVWVVSRFFGFPTLVTKETSRLSLRQGCLGHAPKLVHGIRHETGSFTLLLNQMQG